MFFLELSCFFDDPADVGNLISGSSAFSKTSLKIWKFTVHVLPQCFTFLYNLFFISIPKKCNAKECSNYRTIALKILQARLQQYMKHELPDVQAGFKKVRGTRDQIANICWIIEKAREFQKKHLFLLY